MNKGVMNQQAMQEPENEQEPHNAPSENAEQDALQTAMAEAQEAGIGETTNAANESALHALLQSKDAEIDALKNEHLRALADIENLRRRFAREQSDATKYAITGFARDLVDVLENLKRASDAVPEEARSEHAMLDTIAVGVDMTLKSLAQAFEKNGINRVDPTIGDKFDHNLHQAVSQAPSDEVAPGAIHSVMQAGYTIHDRLLRPAMVVVASKPNNEQGGQVDTSA